MGIAVIALAACNDNNEKGNPNKKEITIGFGVGNYIDQVEKVLCLFWRRKAIK